MKKKKILFLLFLFLFLTAAALMQESTPPYDTVYYTDDYAEIYKEQLQTIFGEDYQISGKETVRIMGEDCGCGYHSDGYEYYTWNISYQDENGYVFTQTLDNMTSLELQQLSWLDHHLCQYYRQKYLNDFFEEGIFEDLPTDEDSGKSYCYVTVGNPVGSYSGDQKEEFKRIQAAGKKYKEQLIQRLQEEAHLFRLSKTDYENIFSRFPITVRFHLSIDDETLSGSEKADFEKRAREMTLEMIEALKQETGGACNLRVQMCSANGHCNLYDGSRDWRYFILRGEQIYPEDSFDGFDWEFFYAFEGIYW